MTRNYQQNSYCKNYIIFRKNLTPFPEDNEKEITNSLKEIRKVLIDKKNGEFNHVKIFHYQE